MKAFPHLVKMHREWADKGLVIITVSVDDEEKFVETASKFLKRLDPPFTKLLLNEPQEYWSKKLDFTTPPCYYIFDRNGRWVCYRGSDYAEGENYYELMDKEIIRMLNER